MKLQYNAPDLESRWRIALGNRLSQRGLDLDGFSARIRNFFVNSLEHYDRLAYRDALAECLHLDMSSEKDRDMLWKAVATPQGISRKVCGQWLSGELDPPSEVLRRHLFRIACPGIKSKLASFLDLIAPVRMAISRTLVYIRVFPAPDELQIEQPQELQTCWGQLRRHVHYRTPRKKPRCDLNQHALDYVWETFGRQFWIEPDEVGRIMREAEHDRMAYHPLYWEFCIFKYSTFADIPSTHRNKANEHQWLWDDSHPRFNEIWGV